MGKETNTATLKCFENNAYAENSYRTTCQVVTGILQDALEPLLYFNFFLRRCKPNEMHRHFLESFLLGENVFFSETLLFIVYDTEEFMLVSGLQVLLQ